MSIQRVRLGLFSNPGRLLSWFAHSCKSYILNAKADQEWAKFAWMEVAAKLGAQQKEVRQRVLTRLRHVHAAKPSGECASRGDRTVPFRKSMSLATMIAGILLVSFVAAQPTSAVAEVWYPWCLHANPLHCWFMNRWQCEETADFRGICEPNPFPPGAA
jgi:hypothetical protein